jgi:D-alanyl-D-alanine dipeptidase
MSRYFIFLLFFWAASFGLAQTDTNLVYLGNVDSTIATDVRYATVNNFTHQVLYPSSKVYLRKIVAEHLALVNKYVKGKYGLRLKVFDGYRPLSVQKKMWKIVPDSRYVANHKNGSRHNRGAAVDLTLIDSTGKELDMGTGFDNFTEKAHYNSPNLTEKQKKNRKLLRDAMMKFGFEPLSTEWWHFDYHGWRKFHILDKVFTK